VTAAADFLVEIGTEELPPKALRSLMDAFAEQLAAALDAAPLGHGGIRAFASPRRLAAIVSALERRQPDRKTTQKGPPVSVAFDDAGKLTAAGTAFAKKCGVAQKDLARVSSDKGEWLSCEVVEKGQAAADILPALVETALAALPIPRRMRWGAGDAEFVRPVHWVILLHGGKVVPGTVLGIRAGNKTRGHRFQGKASITIRSPSDYADALEQQGHVVADFDDRAARIRKGVAAAAKKAGGTAVGDDALYDEVAALVEWPVPVTGRFDERYLELPREVIVSTLSCHQRYFPVAGADGALLPRFVTVANLQSKDPAQVRDGNERVIRPRLADAAFFWESDRRISLAARQDGLRDVVYQQGLGSLYDKCARTAALAATIAAELGVDATTVERAAMLCKCDLLTGMVGEFPELQGTMGRYYAAAGGEDAAVAEAIGEHYLPRFAGDALPGTPAGRVLAIADKLETLAGVFAIGKKPSGNRDPFGLRRAALGIIRILVEGGADIDLQSAIAAAIALQPAGKTEPGELGEELYAFVSDRLRRYFLDRDAGLATETFDAVLARRPASLVDFDRRLAAVQKFVGLEPAASLAAANKRIANILRQAGDPDLPAVRAKHLTEDAETSLWAALGAAREAVAPLIAARDYTAALTALAELRAPVDRFFDDVMVMTEDENLRNNRLALLADLRALFLDVADVSRLAI